MWPIRLTQRANVRRHVHAGGSHRRLQVVGVRHEDGVPRDTSPVASHGTPPSFAEHRDD